MSLHRITAEIPLRFSFPGLAQGERESEIVSVEIEYDYDDTFCNLVKATQLSGDTELVKEEFDDQVQDWLDGDGFERAEAHAKREDLLSEGL